MTSPADPTKNLGSVNSGYLDPVGRNFETVVYGSLRPVLDRELVLSQDITQTANNLKTLMPSGWLSDDFVSSSNPTASIFISSTTPNTIQIPQGLRAHVNGWLLNVTDTNLIGTNQLTLPSPPTGLGTTRTDLVILEVWRTLLSATPSTVGKSTLGRIWGNGNVKTDPGNDSILNYADDLLDTNLGAESTKRVQIQYRLRVVSGIDVFSYPYGMEDPSLVAHTVPPNASTPDGVTTAFPYTNQASNGDPGLWVAGDGNPANTIGTVDGYMYAIPLLAVFRRNSNGFVEATNQNGAVNSPGITLSGTFGVTHSNPSVTTSTSQVGVVKPGFSVVFTVQAGVPYLVTAVTASTMTLSTNFTGTTTGATVGTLVSDRPDGLNSDLIVARDIVDMRLGVSPSGWSYPELLDKNLTYLFDNALTTEWTTTALGGGTKGHTFLWADQIGGTPSNGDGALIGDFDAVRRSFSDRSVYEKLTVAVGQPGGGWANATVTVDFTSLNIFPYGNINWASFAPSGVAAMDVTGAHFIGDFDGNGTKTANILSHISVSGLGANPITSLTVSVDSLTGLGITTETLYLDILIAYPGSGLTKTATNTYGAASFEVVDYTTLPSSGPIAFSALTNTVIDGTHREVQLEYTTVPLVTNTLYASTDTEGTLASVTTVVGTSATITGLTDRTTLDVGSNITISGAASGGNNGTFPIIQVVSPTSVIVTNASAVPSDGNNGAIHWYLLGSTFRLPERAATITSVHKNGSPIVGTVTSFDGTGRTWQFTNPADYTRATNTLNITYTALRPMPQTGTSGVRMNIWYEARAPQTGRFDGLNGGAITSLSVIPRYVSPNLYTLTSGSGSEDVGYPFPNAYVQTGGIYNTSSGPAFTGEHELNGRAAISVADFSASTGMLKLPTFVPYMPDPELVTFNRSATMDIDLEGRTFFKSVPAGYIPNAYAQNLSDPTRHKVIQPMLAELATTSSYGHKGQLVLVLIIRWAVFDATNGVFFDSDLTKSSTTASVFRIKGNLLNKRNV